jgi:hypothetical protein
LRQRWRQATPEQRRRMLEQARERRQGARAQVRP